MPTSSAMVPDRGLDGRLEVGFGVGDDSAARVEEPDSERSGCVPSQVCAAQTKLFWRPPTVSDGRTIHVPKHRWC